MTVTPRTRCAPMPIGRARAAYAAEALERRVLLSTDPPGMVADVNTTPAPAAIFPMASINGVAVFRTREAATGWELYRSDGTAQGTQLLKDINPGPGDSSHSTLPGHFVLFKGALYFIANDGVHGNELWRTDGTPHGTTLAVEIVPGPGGADRAVLTPSGDTLFIQTAGGAAGSALYKSDGTTLGTFFVTRLTYDAPETGPGGSASVNGRLYFTAYDRDHGRELWSSDGTAAGTALVNDINPGPAASRATQLTAVGGTLFFSGWDEVRHDELWKSDGTEAGTSLVKEITAGPLSTTLSGMTTFNGKLLFRALELTTPSGPWRSGIWSSDGTEAGTTLLKDAGTTRFISESRLAVSGATAFFAAFDDKELWKTDGTAAGTSQVAVIGKETSRLTTAAGLLYFLAAVSTPTAISYQLYRSDGTAGGTRALADVPRGITAPPDYSFADANGRLVFSTARTVSANLPGPALWSSDGTAAGTLPIRSFDGLSKGSDPFRLAVSGGKLYFVAFDGNPSLAGGLYTTDGTPAGTVRLSDARNPSQLTDVDGTLYFTASASAAGPEGIYRTDGTPEGTGFVTEGFVQSSLTLIGFNGKLLFHYGDGTVWETDGTQADIRVAIDGRAQLGLTSIFRLTRIGEMLYFDGVGSGMPRRLWKSDGTTAGTVPVATLTAENFVDVNGTLYFTSVTGLPQGQIGLWKSDGTEAGTISLATFNRDTGGSLRLEDPTVVSDMLFFNAYDSARGRELWRSDGTPEGTIPLRDIHPGTGNSNPRDLTAAGGRLFFAAKSNSDPFLATELWTSDGTVEGTIQIPFATQGSPHDLFEAGGRLFFKRGGSVGTEIWTSDGGEAGTMKVFELIFSGSSFDAAGVGGRAYFTANNGVHGSEVWSFGVDYRPLAAAISAVTPDPRGSPVDSATITFNRAVAAGFNLSDLRLSRDAGPNLLSPHVQTLSTADGGVTWSLGNLAGVTAPAGDYVLTLVADGSGIADADGIALADGAAESWRVESADTPPAAVAGRFVFYNNSIFDGRDPAADARDDGAVAPDKFALLPGGVATFANYTGYSRGLNGILVDIAGLPGGTALTAADFSLKVGNDNMPGSWADAPAPVLVTVRPGHGSGGSDRVTLVWPDAAIKGKWLQVTVKASVDTGLPADDVFYFGNAPGESGNWATAALVNSVDEAAARHRPRGASNPAPINFNWDYNRDRLVNRADQLVARANRTTAATALRLITMPSLGAARATAKGFALPAAAAAVAPVVGRSAMDEVESEYRPG